MNFQSELQENNKRSRRDNLQISAEGGRIFAAHLAEAMNYSVWLRGKAASPHTSMVKHFDCLAEARHVAEPFHGWRSR